MNKIIIAFVVLGMGCSAMAGASFTQWVLSHHKDCNTQAREWIAQFPDNQPLATMPSFTCKQ